MFEIGKKYKHRDIKKIFEIDKGSSILEGDNPKKLLHYV
jgi:hypothetical protein